MLIAWALLLLVASTSDAGSLRPRRPPSGHARHFSAPLLTGHAQQARLPHSHNPATRTAAHSSSSARSLRSSGSPLSSPSKRKKKESHLYFLRLQPNKAVPAVSTTTPKPTEAPIFIIKSTPHPGEPPVFIVKPTLAPRPPAPWPSSVKPGHHRPTIGRPPPPAPPTTSPQPQSVHYHYHQQGPSPIVPYGTHHVKYIVRTKTTFPRTRPAAPPPPRIVARPKPQSFKHPPYVHHTHQHLHHHLLPATHIIVRKRPQGPPPPKRRPWGFF